MLEKNVRIFALPPVFSPLIWFSKLLNFKFYIEQSLWNKRCSFYCNLPLFYALPSEQVIKSTANKPAKRTVFEKYCNLDKFCLFIIKYFWRKRTKYFFFVIRNKVYSTRTRLWVFETNNKATQVLIKLHLQSIHNEIAIFVKEQKMITKKPWCGLWLRNRFSVQLSKPLNYS